MGSEDSALEKQMLRYSFAIAALLLSAPMAFAQGADDTRKGGGAGMSSSGPRSAGPGPSSKSDATSHERSGAASGASEGASGSDSPRSRRYMERPDRGSDQGARSEHSPRHVDRDRQFDRGGGRAELRDRDWRRPGYRERIRRGHHYGWGPGIGFYFSDGWYYGECGWLKRRALATDSPVWWHRYRRCREFG